MLGWYVLGGVVAVVALLSLLALRQMPSEASTAWDAGFSRPKSLVADTNGIYLGTSPDLGNRPLYYAGDRSIMTTGPNGSGKSKRLLYRNLRDGLKGWSVVVVDPKGELCDLTRDSRERDGSRTVVLDPFGVTRFASDGYNPVAALDPDDANFPDDALAMAESLIRIEGTQPHFPASAQDLVAGLIMYSRLSQELLDGGSLPHVREMLGRTTGEFRALVAKALALGEDRRGREMRAKLARYRTVTGKNEEMSSVLATALTQTRWLDSRMIRHDLEKPASFRPDELKKIPTTIYLVLPADRIGGAHSTWLRLLITAILKPILRNIDGGEVPLLLMLDEYYAIAKGRFPVIEDNMAMFRGYGIKLWTVWQDLAQAKSLYGEGFESFASNAGVFQAFQPQDNVTAEYLSHRTGMTMREVTNWSWAGKASFSASQQPMPLVLPQALRAMQAGETIILTHLEKGPVRAYLEWPFPAGRQAGAQGTGQGMG